MNRLLWVLLIALLPFVSSHAANPRFSDALRAAERGDARSQYIAGMMLMFGHETKQNLPAAARWLEASSKGGLPQAMVALAALHDIGQGVALDPDRAQSLRQQAARLGNETARGQIESDQTMPGQRDFRRALALTDLKMYEAAIPYARRAAQAGSANGQLLLGRAYHFALGTPKDLQAAVALYRKSEAGKLADGARALAYMYEFGLGVKADRAMALLYYDRAAARGSTLARRAAANLRSPDYDRPANTHSGGGSASRCGGSYSYDYASGSCSPMVPGLRPYNP
ncbi:MAG: sel1 repeat family protein [Rubrivivax sp.]|nr:sel1 repeat family protein [Rubrivivax sp.]MBK7260565.1 sel1 repeat family protein [Rubrivivax sp.]MBK8526241.1 sel1 repeat family protein [Rubrivivax sp.]